MDEQKAPQTAYQAKFKPELNRYRMNNKRNNSLADDFIFVRSIVRNSMEPIVPLMAGVTKADPNYYTDMRINGFGERYLTVLEYVVSGTGHISYNKTERTLRAGCLYILHPTFTGRYYSDANDPFVKKWVNINGRVLPALMKAFGVNEQANIFRNCYDAERYIDQIHEILSDYDEENPTEDNRKLIHILVDLLVMVTKNNAGHEAVKMPDINDIIEYINGNIAYSRITVETLSNLFHFNKRTLSRMFQKELGVSPSVYLTSKKIELAQKMLADNYSVEEVAETLYFSSAEYFRKVFVSVCGISPQKWKKNYQNKK